MLLEKKFRFLIVGLTVLFAGMVESHASKAIEDVIVLANANDPDSLEIADHYVRQRGIPQKNIIALPMPIRETISVREYVDYISNPLLNTLIEKGRVRVVKAREPDFTGRERVSAGIHSIRYLVTVRGVPLRIANDPELLDSRLQELAESFRVNRGSVDSELSLLIGPANLSMTAFVSNPLFAEATSKSLQPERVIRISRLDGPDIDSVRRMIDRTLQAEAGGLKGRAYFDTGGPHALGDSWICSAGEQVKAAFFDTDCETTQRVMDETDRLDAPAIYMGWYRQHAYGPWLRPRWSVPPGAIGFHLHSFSAVTVRSATSGWLGAFVRQGYCATVGNVYEPYLEYTHRPDLLIKALLDGQTFGDAVMLSNPVLSWQGVAIGDPLYRPFKTSLSDQLQSAGENPLDAYVYLREINRLQAKDPDKALRFAQTQFRTTPSLPLVDKLVQLYAEQGEEERAVAVLKTAGSIKVFASDEWMLVKKIADSLSSLGEYSAALDMYKTLMDQKELSTLQQIRLLEDGAAIALKKGEATLSVKWSTHAKSLQ